MTQPVRSATAWRRFRRSTGRKLGEVWTLYRWYLLAIVALAAIGLGFWGLDEHYEDSGVDPPLSTRLYRTLKLFSLGADEFPGRIPPQLELARFLAPLVVFTAIIGAVFAAVQRRSARARARRMRGHTIVVGLGDKGLTLSEGIDASGGSVVVIERDERQPNVGHARLTGIPVLIGDGTERRTLLAAGLAHADHLISVAGEPDSNAAIAAAVLDAQRSLDPQARGRFRSFIEIRDVDVVRELQTAVDPVRARHRQEFFNLEDRAAQALVGGFDDIWDAPRHDEPPGPVIVVGLGQIGAGVIVELARRWDVVRLEAGGRHAGVPLRVVGVTCDRDDSKATVVDALRARYPKIRACDEECADMVPTCAVDVITLDPRMPGDALERAVAAAGQVPVGVVLTIEDEALQVRAALAAVSVLRDCPTRVVVTAPHREGLAGLVRSAVDLHPALEVFPIMESVCRDDEITQGRLAAMARSIHESYRRHLPDLLDGDARDERADVEWNELDADLRGQNVEAAQSTWEGLTSVGLRIIPLRADDADAFRFSEDQIERLAEREHRRWYLAKHPDATPPAWDEVAELDRKKTRRQIEDIPRMLAFAGLQIDDGHVPTEKGSHIVDHHFSGEPSR